MNRTVKFAALFVAICLISLLFVSCDKGSGDTSGNAQNGVISKGDKSEGGLVSELISAGGDVVSKVEDVVSDIISDIMPDNSSHSSGSQNSENSDNSENSVSTTNSDSAENSESPSTVSFASEGTVNNL